MKIINDIGAPNVILKAVERNQHAINPSRYGVTSLIGSPQIRQLKIRHSNEIELPLSSFNWLLMGTALHTVFQGGETDGVFVEEYLRAPIPGMHGVEVSGVADLIESIGVNSYRITDHKSTSVYGRLTDSLPRLDWVDQLNVYAFIYAQELKCTIDEAAVFVFYRDWKVTQTLLRKNYPPSMEVIPIELWSKAKQLEFIQDKIMFHQDAENLSDESLPPCTIDDRWGDYAKYAVKKKGAKRATRLLDKESAAKKMAADLTNDKAKYVVELREGDCWRRCKLNGCSVASFCQQFANSGCCPASGA